jgi:hypothetical protein
MLLPVVPLAAGSLARVPELYASADRLGRLGASSSMAKVAMGQP